MEADAAAMSAMLRAGIATRALKNRKPEKLFVVIVVLLTMNPRAQCPDRRKLSKINAKLSYYNYFNVLWIVDPRPF
jgi:hypothetical protein